MTQGTITKQYYRTYCKTIKQVVKNAKQNHYGNLLLNATNKIKMAWSIIGGKQSTITSTLQHLKKQNEPHSENLHHTNSYFSEIQDKKPTVFKKKTGNIVNIYDTYYIRRGR